IQLLVLGGVICLLQLCLSSLSFNLVAHDLDRSRFSYLSATRHLGSSSAQSSQQQHPEMHQKRLQTVDFVGNGVPTFKPGVKVQGTIANVGVVCALFWIGSSALGLCVHQDHSIFSEIFNISNSSSLPPVWNFNVLAWPWET
ncbi:hypothetical protein CPB86DRAFT_792253, partial [Serendipita vermifera]